MHSGTEKILVNTWVDQSPIQGFDSINGYYL